MQFLRPIEWILFVVGSALLGLYSFAQIQKCVLSRNAVQAFEELPRDAIDSLTGAAAGRVSIEGLDMSLWSSQRIKAYEASLRNQSAPPLGILRIASIRLVVPVVEGTDDLMLNIGVGRIQGTAHMGDRGNIGIAGHRDGFFRGLKDIAVGDEVELDAQGEMQSYVVDEIEIVQPENVGVLEERGYPALTLVTCFPFYYIGHAPKRYIVHAALKAVSQRSILSPDPLQESIRLLAGGLKSLVSEESNKENP